MLDLCRIFRCAWFRWYDSAAIPDWLWRRSRVIVSEGLCRSGHQRISMLRMTIVHFEAWECQGWTSKRTRRFQVGLLEGHPIPSWTSDWLWRRSSATVWEGYILPPTRSMPIRTSEKVSVEGNSWQVEYSPLWRSRVNLEKATRCFRAGPMEDRPIPSWISDRLLKKVKRYCLWSLHLTPDKVNADQDIREGQGISKKPHGAFMLDLCRIFHYAWFRWHDSAWFRPFQKVTSHGFHHDLRPGGRLPRKSITECFRAGPAWKIQKQQPQVSKQLARYWRCLVLVQATALGNHSETVFLRKVCFLNRQGPGNWSQDLCPQQMNRWWQAKETEVKASVNPWEIEKIFIKFWRERLSYQFKVRMKLRKIIRGWSWCGNLKVGAKKFRNCSTWILPRTWNSKITASSGEYMGQCSKRKN